MFSKCEILDSIPTVRKQGQTGRRQRDGGRAEEKTKEKRKRKRREGGEKGKEENQVYHCVRRLRTQGFMIKFNLEH